MPRVNTTLLAFNRGEVGRRALARIDMDRMKLSAETQLNWMPRAIGSMSIRPGAEKKSSTLNNQRAKNIPFFRSMTELAALEFTNLLFRPLVDDVPVTRPAVSTAVTNGDFSAGAGWTVTNIGSAASSITGGVLQFSAIPINSYSTCEQTLSIALADRGIVHAVRVIVDVGRVKFRIGSTSGDDDLVPLTTLRKGEHSLSFTPDDANAYIYFESVVPRTCEVSSITIESAGDVSIASPYTEDDLPLLRPAQSGDVVFIDCFGYATRRIESRNGRQSWSLIYDEQEDGPFQSINAENIKFSIDWPRGDATLTSSKNYFNPEMVGDLFRVLTPGYNMPYSVALEDSFTPAIRVNGVGTGRTISYEVTGTWVGTWTLQKSYIDENSGFFDVVSASANFSSTSYDTSDNTVVWFRIGFKAGNYTSGTAVMKLSFGADGGGYGTGAVGGGRNGICRVTAYTSPTEVDVEILADFSSTTSTELWYHGQWSEGVYPSALAFHEGRLCHGDKNNLTGSVSDNYSSFSLDVTGESGPLQRSIGYGPVQLVAGILPLNRIIMLTEGSEVQVKSSSFDEPLTPTNFSLKDFSTHGSARIAPIKVDTRGFFVNRSLINLMEIFYSPEKQDYDARDMNMIHPDLNLNNPIVHIAVQRKPDTRIHCVRADGTVAIFVYEPGNEVAAWVRYETSGVVEDVYVLPGETEDAVYYVIQRTINGAEVRYHEKWAREDQCQGGTINRIADCFFYYSGVSATVITGIDHLEGEDVIAWGNGKHLGEYTVTGGSITLTEAVTACIVGLGYRARYKSSKLAYAAAAGTALVQKKKVHSLGLLLYNSHYEGLKYGADFDNLSDLPLIEGGVATAANTVYDDYDEPAFEMEGEWSTDSRLCLQVDAPYPATVLACVLGIETNDK